MRHFLLAVFLMLEGCVVYSPRSHVEYVTHSSNVSTVQTTRTVQETLPPPPTKVITQTRTVASTGCSVFVLPPVGEPPTRPVFADPEIRIKADPDVILAEYIKDLEAYIESERNKLERAHQRWASGCKQ